LASGQELTADPISAFETGEPGYFHETPFGCDSRNHRTINATVRRGKRAAAVEQVNGGAGVLSNNPNFGRAVTGLAGRVVELQARFRF